jgi:N6-adenosine-specific RNA methylase IME4
VARLVKRPRGPRLAGSSKMVVIVSWARAPGAARVFHKRISAVARSLERYGADERSSWQCVGNQSSMMQAGSGVHLRRASTNRTKFGSENNVETSRRAAARLVSWS